MTQSNSSNRNDLSSHNINKSEDHRNRGVDFLLNGGKRKQTHPFHIIFEKMVCFLSREVTVYFEFSFNIRKRKVVSGERKMLAASLVFGSILTILFLILGVIIGWTAREYMMNYREIPRPHPEMFDQQGNLIPDEVIAFNFENYYDDSSNDEENDD